MVKMQVPVGACIWSEAAALVALAVGQVSMCLLALHLQSPEQVQLGPTVVMPEMVVKIHTIQQAHQTQQAVLRVTIMPAAAAAAAELVPASAATAAAAAELAWAAMMAPGRKVLAVVREQALVLVALAVLLRKVVALEPEIKTPTVAHTMKVALLVVAAAVALAAMRAQST